MIQNIAIKQIDPHPDNPRKKLGDLTELTESIRINGILQNLTVVPGKKNGRYRVVIGHRRLAAAKKAGLKEVPCAVSNMDEKTQIATMMIENIQRNDLTALEQAQGFQLMMDLGDTVAAISNKTGMSETTIRRRVKLLELDGKKVEAAFKRGTRLEDFAELEKISDPELKNQVLGDIGTSNFKWQLESAIRKEQSRKKLAEIIEVISQFATQVETDEGMRQVRFYNSNTDFEIPDDMETTKYYFRVSEYGTVYLLVEDTHEETAEEAKERLAKEDIERRRAGLNELRDRAYKMRREFISEFNDVKGKHDEIIKFAARVMSNTSYSNEKDGIAEMLGVKTKDLDKAISTSPLKALLVAAYCVSGDSKWEDYHGYDCEYKKNKTLSRVYGYLEELGYEMSDEEKALRDGTHELFIKKDKPQGNEPQEDGDSTDPVDEE